MNRSREVSIGTRNPSYSTLAMPWPDAEQHPPTGQVVEQRICSARRIGIVPRKHDHAGAELDAPGLAGQVGQQLQRVGHIVILGEVVLDRPHRVEPHISACSAKPSSRWYTSSLQAPCGFWKVTE